MGKILVTGGTGMVGKHLKEILPNATYIGSDYCDLTDIQHVRWLISSYEPDVVVHLAARVGGIKDNVKYPLEYFNDNVLMNTNLIKICQEYKVKRVISLLSTCIYPDVVDSYPMNEKDIFLGPPAKSNFSYAYAKRALAVQIDASNAQYGTNYNYLIPCNLYREYDNYNDLDKMHFVTSLIYKIKNSQNNEIELFGDGTPLRQFMYAGDLAEIIKLVIENNITENFNIATKENLTIDKMAKITLEELGLPYKINYIEPDLKGQYRKDVASDKFNSLFPEFEFTLFKDGIKKVYDKISK